MAISRSRRIALMVVASAALLAACSTSPPMMSQRSPSPSPRAGIIGPNTSTGATKNTDNLGLVLSNYSDCNQGGEDLVHYLQTGQPTSNDPTYGNERQGVLSLPPGDSRDLAIRQYADAYISQCATVKIQAAAAAAQAAADASAAQAKAQADAQAQAAAAQSQAQAQAAAAALQQKEQTTCIRLGGVWGAVCQIIYRSPSDGSAYYYTLNFDQNGDPAPGVVKDAAQCATYYGPGITATWHPDTYICSI